MLKIHFSSFKSQCHHPLDFLCMPGHGKGGDYTAVPKVRDTGAIFAMFPYNSRYLADSWVERASPRTFPSKLITQAPVSSQEVSIPKIRDRDGYKKVDVLGRSFWQPPLMLLAIELNCLLWRPGVVAVKEVGENLGELKHLRLAIPRVIVAIFWKFCKSKK